MHSALPIRSCLWVPCSSSKNHKNQTEVENIPKLYFETENFRLEKWKRHSWPELILILHTRGWSKECSKFNFHSSEHIPLKPNFPEDIHWNKNVTYLILRCSELRLEWRSRKLGKNKRGTTSTSFWWCGFSEQFFSFDENYNLWVEPIVFICSSNVSINCDSLSLSERTFIVLLLTDSGWW